MVFCSKCGNENEDEAVYCKKCGYLLKKEHQIQEKQSLLALIKIKPIIFGGIATIIFFVIFFVFFAIAFFSSSSSLSTLPLITGLSTLFLPVGIGGLVAGYHSNNNSLSGILNGAIIAIMASLISLFIDFNLFLVILVFFIALGAAGGFIGVQIKKRID